MHPVRANDPRQVEMCASQILALQACHREWKKWWGGCNDTRMELDKCLREEKQIRRTKNLQNSKAWIYKAQSDPTANDAAQK
jgi:hypothetical protein